ncbi:hypothetical protein Daura_23075 [Dactylosporangium aurantiacum]|uniref:Uncharacterized protein n=1 Tax=Dactylosporangium aurantiacum TaxID=35754 RepID=A0A9Q9MJA1_9ACTN|nr:hypothetical protein [Dactylosporangium aurantiacum]MDG6104031.1 hypothetical protein [Dactylosporangium aurantiacum]UWZ58794.1 hypothetical protein Daura_23075 [Dactylosporangium aurantiacum]
MMPARDEMACAVCFVPLNVFNGEYGHPLHHDTDGHQPVPVPVRTLDTVRRVCDFCGDPQSAWTITGGNVAVLGVGVGDQQGLLQDLGAVWAACVPCTIDIEAGRTDAPAERAARRAGLHRDAVTRAAYRTLHAGFLADRRPGRTLITTTAWPDLTLDARHLPRIRDGLTRLCRGPLGLPATTTVPYRRTDLADSLDRARLYWVDDDFTDMAEAATADLPAVTATSNLAPCDDGLLIWSRSIAPRGITAASWKRRDNATWIVLYRAIGGGLRDEAMQALRGDAGWLTPIRDHILDAGQQLGECGSHPLAPVLATWLLIAQGAAETEPAAIDKNVRKKYARAKRPLPDVRIIHIRTRHNANTGSSRTATSRAYTSRVWVTGHWRDQPYGPGRALRRPVYIHPHLRGPKDAEIKLSTTVRILSKQKPDDAPEADV